MSQRAVECVLGKLLTDDQFRNSFFQDAGAACFRAGFVLTAIELQALRALPPESLQSCAERVDDRIRRMAVPDPQNPEGVL